MATHINLKLRFKNEERKTPEGQTPNYSKVINEAIKEAEEKSVLEFPDGVFFLKEPIYQNKCVHWQGGLDTVLRPMNQKGPCFIFTRPYSIPPVKINDIVFFNGSSDPNNRDQDCLFIETRVKIKDCEIRNFRGTAIILTGDSSKKTDASFCRIDSLTIESCIRGYYIYGGDANMICSYHLDIRDCEEEGYVDAGFLGSHVYGGMAHANKKGHWHATSQAGAAALHVYGEGDSPQSTVVGGGKIDGFNENGVRIDNGGTHQRGRKFSHITVGGLEMDESRNLRLASSHGYSTSLLSFAPVTMAESGPWAHWKFKYEDINDILHIFGGTTAYPAKVMGRDINIAGAALPHYFLGSRLILFGTPEELSKNYIYQNAILKVGDIIYNSNFNGTNNERWVCLGNGSWKNVTWIARN